MSAWWWWSWWYPTSTVDSNSPDLNPFDYSVWEILQEKVYKTRITELDETATENGVGQAGRRHCGSHSSMTSSLLSVADGGHSDFWAPSFYCYWFFVAHIDDMNSYAIFVDHSCIFSVLALWYSHTVILSFCMVSSGWLGEVDIRSTNSFPARSIYCLLTSIAMGVNL